MLLWPCDVSFSLLRELPRLFQSRERVADALLGRFVAVGVHLVNELVTGHAVRMLCDEIEDGLPLLSATAAGSARFGRLPSCP